MYRSANEWIRVGHIFLSDSTMAYIRRKCKGNRENMAKMVEEEIAKAYS